MRNRITITMTSPTTPSPINTIPWFKLKPVKWVTTNTAIPMIITATMVIRDIINLIWSILASAVNDDCRLNQSWELEIVFYTCGIFHWHMTRLLSAQKISAFWP
jgi:hypothetical protein